MDVGNGRMRGRGPRIVGLLLACLVGSHARAADRPPPAPPRIAETQLTLRLHPLQGQATVVAIAEETLTIVTAAHFLSAEDVGRPIQIQREGQLDLRGRVLAVTQNPGFRPLRSRTSDEASTFGTLGVDTAVAVIQVDLHDEGRRRAFEKIQPADLTTTPIPSGARQILTVHIVDQFGAEHVVRAGNHLNPKCLAWGRRNYDTQRGDSGAGVFVLRRTPGGDESPVLIGNVSQTDERGGIASLTHGNEPWIKDAIVGRPSQPR